MGTKASSSGLIRLVICLAWSLCKILDERGQQNTAHLLLQNDLVLTVVVTSGDKRREQHFDQPRVTEILEGQLAELLQHRWVAAGLHDDLVIGVVDSEEAHADDDLMKQAFTGDLAAVAQEGAGDVPECKR